MTQEEKQLLLIDICGRMPYHPFVYGKRGYAQNYGRLGHITWSSCAIITDGGSHFLYLFDEDEIKPYLRPLSSMTEEEKDELYTAMDWYGEIDETGDVYTKGQEKVYKETFYEYTDWLNAHHFDFRGLIPMGLALEAPKGIYEEK